MWQNHFVAAKATGRGLQRSNAQKNAVHTCRCSPRAGEVLHVGGVRDTRAAARIGLTQLAASEVGDSQRGFTLAADRHELF